MNCILILKGHALAGHLSLSYVCIYILKLTYYSCRGIRADFLENEAELSGSDVNSDDEMEDSDDNLEEEEGDKEQFDATELRNQVRLCS